MTKINNIEKGAFVKLLNRGGYVLDFSTADFDAFTMNSVGVPLCQRYNLSKGKSLIAYVEEASEDEVIKLFNDLLLYYETNYFHFSNEIGTDRMLCNLYNSCKVVMQRIHSKKDLLASSAENLKDKFSSDYISAQIDLMLQMQRENPTEAIGKAKEFIESCCTTVLEESGRVPDEKWNIVRLVDETFNLLEITPRQISENAPEVQSIKAILGNLKVIAVNVATLRNAYGSGHGKGASYKGLEERHAKLAVGSSITLVNFLWDSHERKQKLS